MGINANATLMKMRTIATAISTPSLTASLMLLKNPPGVAETIDTGG